MTAGDGCQHVGLRGPSAEKAESVRPLRYCRFVTGLHFNLAKWKTLVAVAVDDNFWRDDEPLQRREPCLRR